MAKADESGSTKRLAVALLESMTSLWALCTKQASRTTKRIASKTSSFSSTKPRQLLATISNKAIHFREKRRIGEEKEQGGGVWQRAILMGDKCQPLDFDGVIYYDSDGKRVSELPMKSPRASPLPNYAYKTTMKSKK